MGAYPNRVTYGHTVLEMYVEKLSLTVPSVTNISSAEDLMNCLPVHSDPQQYRELLQPQFPEVIFCPRTNAKHASLSPKLYIQ